MPEIRDKLYAIMIQTRLYSKARHRKINALAAHRQQGTHILNDIVSSKMYSFH